MRFDRIIAGVDFSPESAAAARWVADRFPAASLTLVHAVPPPEPARVPGRRFVTSDELADVACSGARERIEEFAEEFAPRQVSARAVCGEPAEVLAKVAAEGLADLIVVGPHARLSGFRGLMGSTAEALLLGSPVPVFLVSQGCEGELKTVLAPVDGSPLTREVLAVAHEVATGFGAQLVALHVHPTATFAALSVLHSSNGESIKREAAAESRFWLDQYLDLARVPRSEAELATSFGEARHEILAMAQQTNADMIIMGSHGGGGAIFKRVLGSVAAWVLRHARKPVLVLHGAALAALTVEEAARDQGSATSDQRSETRTHGPGVGDRGLAANAGVRGISGSVPAPLL